MAPLRIAAMILVVSSGLTACFKSTPDMHPDKVLTKRKALFKQFNRALEPIALVAKDRSDYKKDEFLAAVQDFEKLSGKPWAYFPTDGNYAPTHAKPTVWSKPAEFKEAQDKYLASVKGLVGAAEHGDLDKIKAAVNQVTDSCKSCHQQFRDN